MIANFASGSPSLIGTTTVPFNGVKNMSRAQMNSLLHDIDRETAERMIEVAMDQIMPIGVATIEGLASTANLLPLTATTTKGTSQVGGVNAFCVMQGAASRTERRIFRFPVANTTDGDLADETHIGGIVIGNTDFNSLDGILEAGATLNPAIDERVYWTTSNGAHAVYRSMTQGTTVITTTGARYADYAYSNGRYYRQLRTSGFGTTIQTGTGTQLQDVSWADAISMPDRGVFWVPSEISIAGDPVCFVSTFESSELRIRRYRGGNFVNSSGTTTPGFTGDYDTYSAPRAIWVHDRHVYVILVGDSDLTAWCIVRSDSATTALGIWDPVWTIVFEHTDYTGPNMDQGFRAFPSQGQFCQIVHVGLGRIAWSVDGLRWHLRSVPGGGSHCKIVGNQLYTPLGVSGFL